MFSTIEVEINENCNMSCSYCPNATAKRTEQGEMSDEVFDTLLGQLKDINYSKNIGLHFYGEPLLSPNLERRIAGFRKELPAVKILVYSNGTLLTEAKLKSLVTAGLSKIIVTKHSDSYDKHFAFDQVFEDLGEELKSFVKYQPYTNIKLTNRGGAVKIEGAKAVPDAPCYIPTSMLVVTLKGNVLPCFEDYFQKYEMGNIMQSDVMKIWQSEKYKNFRRDLKLGLRSKYEICKVCNRTEVLTTEAG